jgi:aminoglycoside 3-N-acetyltransferase
MVTKAEIVDGLHALGLTRGSAVLVHASLRSFGHVDGGPEAVCEALMEACGTVMVPSGTWDLTGVPAPPGLVRPNNAANGAVDWEQFEQRLADAVPFSSDLPIDSSLGIVPETLRKNHPHVRSTQPLFGFLATGEHADHLIGGTRDDWSLGPIDALAQLDGDVLLLGVDHTVNTTIHLSEQRLGRGRFFRYAKVGEGVWAEFPNISGESHRFNEIEPELKSATTTARIGECRARRVRITDVLATTERLIQANPKALLCDDNPACRCNAAYKQRLLAH